MKKTSLMRLTRLLILYRYNSDLFSDSDEKIILIMQKIRKIKLILNY